MTVAALVITVSDGASAGTRPDTAGPAVADRLAQAGFAPIERLIVADEVDDIRAAITDGAADGNGLVVTTGGTGLGPRDVTPEATAPLLDRQVPGIAEAMRAEGRLGTPLADLSRGLVGAIGTTLVANLPGSERGALENLEVLVRVAPHAIKLLGGDTEH